MTKPEIDAVVIGRNEGARLVACLKRLTGKARRVVYVDSGSDDGSVAAATELGAEAVMLDLSQPFTAARARNAGLDRLRDDPPDFVQFIDGDCALRSGWLPAAAAHLETHPDHAVVCGRRRERFPEASVYNQLCDEEWDTPPGLAKACGGDALMRWEALTTVGGYRDDLIAGEEPELCVRLRQAGWQVFRLDQEMTWHDADMTRFGQWWRRARRAGYAFAEGASLHGDPPERHWVTETRRALIWGLALPLVALVGAAVTPLSLLILLAYPAQILRLSLRGGLSSWSVTRAGFTVLGKLAEALGVVEFHLSRLWGRRRGIIEYK